MKRSVLAGGLGAAALVVAWLGWSSARPDLRQPRFMPTDSSVASFRTPPAWARRRAIPLPPAEGLQVDIPVPSSAQDPARAD